MTVPFFSEIDVVIITSFIQILEIIYEPRRVVPMTKGISKNKGLDKKIRT
jgi:hypothetical protein